MASSKTKMGSALSDMNIGELRVQVAKLRSELDTERKLTKQLRREKSLEVKESLKREQCKNSIAFNDLKTKLRQDKVKEIDLQRSLLTKKFDAELKKVTQQKDLEISKLKSRIHSTHAGPKTRTKNSGLSDMAQSSFEAERDKMRKEIEELKATRSKLEEQLRMLTESDRQKSEELRKQEEFHKVVVSKLKREADQEVRRLLDELRCRDRCLSQMQRELNTQAAQLSQLRADKEQAQNTLDLTRQAVSWERRSPRKNSSSFIPVTEEPKEPELITLKSKTTTEKTKDTKNNNEMTLVVWKDKCSALEMACEELGDLYHDLEEKCGNLEDQVRVQEETIDHLEVQTKELEKDKDDLNQQVQQAEKKQQAVLEKNKEFLKKNVRLTKDVRQLEARVRELTEETFGMKTEVDSYQRECSRLREQVNYGNLQKETLAMMQQELQLLRQQRMEQDRTIMALGLACADKDKRIELIAFKRRKQKKALVKKKMVRFLLPAKARAVAELEEESYYGYDEDSNESELSQSTQISGASLEDDSLLEDVPPYQMERNYQQLVREHLELERSYSELQTQHMYQENSEQMQTNEKVMQTKINKLQKKMEEYKQRHNQISSELFEAQEQNEILEFRLLELEETNEKLTEEIQKLQSERLTKETREMETAEPDFGHVDMNSLNMKIQVVAQKLAYMKESQEINLRPDDKTSLAQASIVLKAAVYELDSQREREEALKQIITSLEHQQRALQSASVTVPPDLVQKYEWSRSQLTSAYEELRQMELEVYELRKENEELLNSQQDTNIFKPVIEKSEQPNHQLLSQENKRLTDHIAELEQKLQQVPASGVPEFTNDSCDSDSSICDSGIFERSMTESIDEMSEMDTLYEEEEDEFLRSQAEEEEKLKKQQETQHQECHTELSLLRQDLEICRRQVESREHMIENLEEKVGQVERERDRVTERLGQLEEIKKHLEDEVSSLKWVQEENCELQTLKAHLEEAENIKLQLQERISELQVLTEEETNRSLNLEEQIQSLEDSNENFQSKLNSAKQENQKVKQELADALFAKDEEYEHKIRSLKRAESELLTTIKQLKWKLQDSQDKEIQVRDQLALVTEEKQRRIQSLERQVDCMAENESLLNETIISLEDKEGDLKQKVQTMEKYKTKCNNISTEMDKVKEENKRLSERVKELAARESDLLEQLYKSNLDNQELQDHIDELIAQSEGADSDGNSTGKDNEQWQLADLQRSLAALEKENKELKDNLLQAKLALINSVEDVSLLEGDAATMAQMGQKLAEAEKTEQHLKDENKSITEKQQKLEAKLSKLEKKIDFLNKNEQKLYEQLDIMEEDNAKLRDQLELAEKESHKDKLEQHIKSHEKKEEDLKQTILLLQEEKQAAEMKLISQIQNQAEIEGLQEKVDTLMKAQEHLMDKLAEKELTETQLRATITDLTEKCQYDSHQKIAEMECTEKELKNELNEWEKMCKEYREKVRELEKEIAQYKANESEHEDIEISHMKKVKSLEGSVFNLQVAESELKIKITQLETENMRLAELLREAKAAKSLHETFTTDSGNITMCSDDLLKTDETETFNYREALTKVELLAKVHEMERLDELNKARIIDLEDNLEKLREALQHEAVTMEVDTDIPMLHHRPETKDTEYEARVQSLVKTEISSRLKVFEVQKENIELRAELDKKVQAEAIQEQEHKVQQDLQLCELDRLRKSEASLKEMLEYSNLGQDGEEAEKIRHLEVQVADLEMSELKHKQRIEELKRALKSLEQKVQEEDKDVLNRSPLAMALKDIKDKDVYYKLVEEISVLEESDSELKNKLTDLDKADKLRLLERIAELERSEKGLIRKVELLENQEVPATPMCENPAALDSPEAIMRQRIYDLEKVERQMKQQVSISKEAEQENTSLHQRLGRCQDEICELERERQDLKDRLELYEYSHANKELATVPRSELTQLRAQVKLLEEAETNVTRLQKSEQNLAETVKKLRQGMDVCGHEVELEELESKLEKQSNVLKEKEGLQRALNSTKKAYEILKENNDEVKGQLKKLHGEIQNGNISVRVHGLSGLSYNKGVQCCLTDIITIRGGTKEFQAALKRLGTEHPDAYHVFLRALLKKTSESTSGSATMRVSTEEVHEDVILPHLKIKPGSETARAYHHGDRKTVLDDLVSHLLPEDEAAASSTQGTQNKTDTATHTEAEHSQMIDSLVTLLPSGDIACLLTEEDYWAQIEGKPADRLGSVLSDVYWKEIEGDKSNAGLALAVNFSEDTDGSQSDSSTGGSHKPIRPLSSTSLLSFSSEGSSAPPPLPMSEPPPTVTEETMETMDNHDDKPDSSLPVLYSNLEKSPKHTAVSVGDHTACIAEINRLKDLIKEKEQELTKAKNREQEMTKQMLDMGDAKVLSGQLENEKARAQELEAKVADLLVETTHCKAQISSLQTKADQTEKSSKAAENLDQALKDMEGNALVQKIQLERKDRELAAKVNESDHLTSELRHCQENCQRLKEEKQRVEEMLKSCQQTIDELTDINNKYQELQKQYAMLKQQHADLSNNHQALESDVEDKKSLETIILKLQGQLKDMDRLELEHQDLQSRQEHTQETLNKKVQSESKLTKENISLQHDLDQCQRENMKYKEMEKEYNHIQSKFDEMVQIKLKSQSSVAPLRAKVIKLSHKCREKDALIKCLASELRQTGKPSDFLAETDRVEAQSASEEYNRPVSPLFHSTPTDPKLFSSGLPEELPHKVSQPSRIPRWASSHESTDDLPLEHEIAPVQHTLVNTDYRQRSKSAGSTDWGSLEEDQQRPGHTSHLSRPSNTLPNNQRSRSAEAKVPKLQTLKNISSVSNCYRAVKDYDPTLYSQSGRQELEIPLTEGDTVRLLGPKDGCGYCEAEVHGRVGLVPHGYLQPVQPGTPLRLHRQQQHHVRPSSKRVASRDQVLAMPPRDDIRQHPSVHLDAFSFVGLAGVGSHGSSSLTGGSRSISDTAPGAPVSRPSSVPAQRQTTPTSLSSVHSHPHLGESLTGRPAPPDHFRVERVLGRQSILLTWQPPTVDKQMRSNGAKVKGYKIYINHQEKQTIDNLHLTKAIVQRLDLHRRNQFSIQTLATDGQTSPMVHTVMDAIPTSAESVSDRDMQVDSDMSSVLSSALLDDGDRRVFMAVYDYNPAEHSPHDFTASELALNTGDIVVTYGSERPDGFYHGKVHGRKGLVPASFIEEVALLRPKRKKVAVTSSTTSSLQRPLSRSSSRLSGESMQPGNLQTTSHHQS